MIEAVTEVAPRPQPYRRFVTRVVRIGDVAVGGSEPIRVQSMTTPATTDTPATVAQIVRLVEAGCEIVRVTVPSRADAENLPNIRRELARRAIRVPLVADIHFTPAAAMLAVERVEKVRINPGNFADKKKFAQHEYSDAEYQGEVERIGERFRPLVERARTLGVALRIGTNHGSLSDRIMNRYGDTALGMVESALEFVRFAEAFGHRELVLSMKSSNPLVCIEAYRLLRRRMEAEGMAYPLHLGVTEAGDAEDGRIKSAIGIGTLLEEGLGDTVRVSLTEDPVAEIPVAYALVDQFNSGPRRAAWALGSPAPLEFLASGLGAAPARRALRLGPLTIGGDAAPIVEARVAGGGVSAVSSLVEGIVGMGVERPAELVELALVTHGDLELLDGLTAALGGRGAATPLGARLGPALITDEAVLARLKGRLVRVSGLPDPASDAPSWRAALGRLADWARADGVAYLASAGAADVPAFVSGAGLELAEIAGPVETVMAALDAVSGRGIELLAGLEALPPALAVAAGRHLAARLASAGLAELPIVLSAALDAAAAAEPLVAPAVALGALVADGIGDALRVTGGASRAAEVAFAWDVLQATRRRISKTEFISCPSCGRTLFDLETTTQRIKSKTGHLKGLKIAIMGCIVNGPGEMADADFGYVGWGPGKVSLFVGKDMVVKDVPEAMADDRLIELIKSNGRWLDRT